MSKPADRPRCSATIRRTGPTRMFGYGERPWCARPGIVERDGKHYCKQHEERDAVRQAQEREQREARGAADRRIADLGCGTIHYAWRRTAPGGYTGGVVLSAEECDALIARLSEVPR